MTADIKLPPIAVSPYTDRILAAVRKQDCADPLFRILEDYACACVAHATAAKDAEIERLRVDLEAWKASHSTLTDTCHHFQARAERLEKALRDLEVCANTIDGCYTRNPGNFAVALRELRESAERSRDALLRDQEVGNG